MKLIPSSVLLISALLTHIAFAQSIAARQDHEQMRQIAEQFLRVQTAGLPGEVSITVAPVETRLNLAACAQPQAFLPNGGRAWGKTTIGIRCSVPAPWTVYVSASVQVFGEYIAAAAPLAQGQTIGPNDVAKIRGDLTALPAGIITDPSQAVGRTAAISLALGSPLRQDTLRNQQAVQQGQMVRLVSIGSGFRVSTEGRALGNAGDGQMIQARTPAGQTVSGVAKMGGIVEVSY